jgi:hypothetical protein
VVLYAGQSRAGANRTHGVYGINTAYKPYGTFFAISYFYGQPYGTIPYGMVTRGRKQCIYGDTAKLFLLFLPIYGGQPPNPRSSLRSRETLY